MTVEDRSRARVMRALIAAPAIGIPRRDLLRDCGLSVVDGDRVVDQLLDVGFATYWVGYEDLMIAATDFGRRAFTAPLA